ncbi:MAG: hypothetical protein RL434_2743 [Pseudomonadota bacterium]|jgi:hypothetical protein
MNPPFTQECPALNSPEVGTYITFAGPAQTSGRFEARPFPALVDKAPNAPVLNLGFDAYGPGAFSSHPRLLETIHSSRSLVLQVMAGRSAGNSAMKKIKAREVLYKGQEMYAEQAWKKAMKDDSLTPERFWMLVDEARQERQASRSRILDGSSSTACHA